MTFRTELPNTLLPLQVEKLTAQFWARVSIRGPEDCWLWIGPCSQQYGRFYIELARYDILAHRFAYMRFVGEIPADCVIHHRCGNPLCVNPQHLEALTPSEHVMLHEPWLKIGVQRGGS